MGKFKVGDTVRCVSKETVSKNISRGYVAGKEFIVDEIRDNGNNFQRDIYFPKNGHGVYECDLELVEELVKTLPKSFACKNTNKKLWNKYIEWLNTVDGDQSIAGDSLYWPYYGVTTKGTYDHDIIHKFDTILSLEEWDEIVNGNQIQTKEEVMKTIQITRTQLKEIWDVACNDWKVKILEFTERNPFGDMIEFTQTEVDTMFKAATLDQTLVLEGIFGKQTREIDLSTGRVDGLKLFKNHDDCSPSFEFLIARRGAGNLCSKSFYLNENFNWEIVTDDQGIKCLVPTRK